MTKSCNIMLTAVQQQALQTLEINHYCFKTRKMLLLGIMTRRQYKVKDIIDYKDLGLQEYSITYKR